MFSQVTWAPLLYLPKPLPCPSFKYLIKWMIHDEKNLCLFKTYREGGKKKTFHLKETKNNAVKLQKCPQTMTLTFLSFPFSKPWCLSLTLPAVNFRDEHHIGKNKLFSLVITALSKVSFCFQSSSFCLDGVRQWLK